MSGCIDCGCERAVMLTQTAKVGKATREWRVCVPCWREYERVAEAERKRRAG